MEHGVEAVGLRFFTVYGPWGRPDMAVYKFAKKIMVGDTIVLHEHRLVLHQDEEWCMDMSLPLVLPSQLSVQRDFTYIDDVVESVFLALDHTPFSCSEVYNVGRGQPAPLKLLLQLLEKELGKTAKLVI